jgi:RNA polymerase sigma-B factor
VQRPRRAADLRLLCNAALSPAARAEHALTMAVRTPRPGARERMLEERDLFSRLVDGDDPVDREHVVERYLPLARRLARRYQRADEPFDDLFQVACVGLIRAIDRFEIDRGVAFSSYALPTIVGEIKRYYRDRTWAVHVPRDLLELTLRVERTLDRLEGDLHRSPTVSEVAAAIGATEEDVLDALEAATAYRATSFEVPRGRTDDDDADTLGDSLGTFESGFDRAEERATLDSLMATLTPRERRVLRLRFEHDLTQAEIGARIGVSQMQVSRILRRCVGRLQGEAAHRTPAPGR